MNIEKKFETIDYNNVLSFPEKGDIVNDGENDLLVCAVEKIDDKTYVLLFDEKTIKLALYEVTETADSFDYTLVHDDAMMGKVMLNIAKREDEEGVE